MNFFLGCVTFIFYIICAVEQESIPDCNFTVEFFSLSVVILFSASNIVENIQKSGSG
jgi:hypothetical protein